MVQDGEVYHYHLDHLGTPQELSNAEGKIVRKARYKTYGNVAYKEVDNIDNNIRFQGQYFDEETGLHYNRHRYYDPSVGQFISQDPIGLLGGVNNYQYAPNPTGWVDPLGLLCKEQFKKVPGSTYEGRIHRMEKPGQTDTTWEAGPWNVNASHRYSGPGQGAVYGGIDKQTAIAEVQHYDNAVGYSTSDRKYKYKDVKIDNVLDLTDASVRNQLGVTEKEL